MFLLLWATLLFCVTGSNADTGQSQPCNGEYCITLSEGQLTAEAGLCVVIPCSFQTAFKPHSLVWYKCKSYTRCDYDLNVIFDSNKKKYQYEFEGRVSLLEPDVSQNNCSIIINDLKESDSGSYQLRVTGEQYGRPTGFTFPAKATVYIGGLTQKPRIKIQPMTEGQQAKLTCIAPGLCSDSIPEITWTWRGAGETESFIPGSITSVRTKPLTAFSQRHISTLTFNSSAEHHNTNVTCKIRFPGEKNTEESSTLKVNYIRTPQITGNSIIKEGDVLNLTCSVESFPPALIMWKDLTSNTNLHSGTYTDQHNDNRSAILFIHNVTAEHSGLYVCTAKHLDTTVTSSVSVIVAWFSKIQNGSGCVLQAEVLTCVCISEGFPLPTIKWPLLKNHNEYSVITTVSNHSVKSTVSLTVKNHGNSIVECVSNNEKGEAKENLLIQNLPKKEVLIPEYLEIIIAFLIGVILTATFCFFSKKCPRKKQKNSGNLDETLEMVTSQDDPQIYDDHTLQDNQTHPLEVEDGGVAAEKEVPEFSSTSKEVEYANIDFSLLKRKGGRESARTQESTKTVYAEIKKAVKEEKEDDAGEEGEMVESKKEEVGIEVDSKQCEPAKEEGEDETLYSTVKDIMDKI